MGFDKCPKGWVTATEDPHYPPEAGGAANTEVGFNPDHPENFYTNPDEATRKTMGYVARGMPKLSDCTYYVNEYTTFYQCPGANRTCKVHKKMGNLSCHEGNWGVLCGKCRLGYVMEGTGECKKCDPFDKAIGQNAIPMMLLFAAGVGALSFLVTYFRKIFRVYRALKQKLTSRLKMLIVFYQICLLMGKIFQVPFPTGYMDFLANFKLFEFNFFWQLKLGCLYIFDFHTVLYGWTRIVLVTEGFVIFTLALLAITHAAQNIHEHEEVELLKRQIAKEKADKRKALKDKMSREGKKKLNGEEGAKKRKDWAYYQNKMKHDWLWVCDKADDPFQYARDRIWIWVQQPAEFIVEKRLNRPVEILCGQALLLTYLIYPYSCQLIFSTFQCKVVDSVRYLEEDFAVDCDGPLHTQAKNWAALMIVLFPVGLPTLYFLMLAPHANHITVGDTEHIRYLEFFFHEYDPDYYYWEVVECARKCILMGFASLVKPGSVMQLILVMVMTVIYMLIITRTCPYKRKTDNELAVFVNTALFFVLLGALMMKFAVGFKVRCDSPCRHLLLTSDTFALHFLLLIGDRRVGGRLLHHLCRGSAHHDDRRRRP
jgi:hypothetical protein